MNESRQGGASIDETTARKELTDDMLIAGVMAFHDWKDRRQTDGGLSDNDLIAAIWVAFRRSGGYSQG
jgi:hypothetical protein